MAEFDIAFEFTDNIEGGYSHDPNDSGGETYRGIARKFNPNWDGWEIIDGAKSQLNVLNDFELTKELKRLPDLDAMVRDFYYKKYWSPVAGDKIHSQAVAGLLYDCAVNHGIGDAATWTQQTLNALNRGGYAKLTVDGNIGGQTCSVLNEHYSTERREKYLIIGIAGLRIAYYIELSKGRYMRGWLSRASSFISKIKP